MFCESHPIVKSDILELHVRIVRKKSPYKDKAGSALIAAGDLENIMTLVFSGFSFILHLAHHLASLLRRKRWSFVELDFLKPD